MSVIRIVLVRYPSERADEAARVWKEQCGPLIAGRSGCLGEELYRCRDVPGEFVSYSEWDSEANIRGYLESDAWRQIRAHHRAMGGGDVVIRLYDRL